MLRALCLLCLFALAACAGGPQVSRVAHSPLTLPAAHSFGPAPAPRARVGNAVLARDFLRLSFQLESGREIPVLTRFEGPVTVRLFGGGLRPVNSRDLDLLIARLRGEAGIDIRRVGSDDAAAINVQLVDRRALNRTVPNAACFVVPNVAGWTEFQRRRGSPELDWTQLRERRLMAVFIPDDVSPQEVRDCLHEEIAQALGPVNDLYDLPDSVFNDDNFHTILTGFDIAILRLYYDVALRNGMARAEVAARLPDILARQRPQAGRARPPAPPPTPTPPAWRQAIEQALGARARDGQRQQAAARVVAIARAAGLNDTRLAFSLYALGRLTISQRPDQALAMLAEADEIYRARPETAIHSAHVAAQTAAFALAAGRPEATIQMVDRHAPVALAGQNAGLLSSLLMLKSAALERMGRREEAAIVRDDALAWARYGFRNDAEIRQRLGEITALAQARTGKGDS